MYAKLVVAFAFCLQMVLISSRRLGNPDEWGPHFQGDIKLRRTRTGARDEIYRWPNGLVKYEFDQKFKESNKEVVLKAMQTFDNFTDGCVKFMERTDEKDYVVIQDTEIGCSSFVGRQGGRQTMNLPQECIDVFATVQHELFHSLGFVHEHTRPIRDLYVTILWPNIQPGQEYNFNTFSYGDVESFEKKYDFGSIMHYSAYAFTSLGLPTILPIVLYNLLGDENGNIQLLKDINPDVIDVLLYKYPNLVSLLDINADKLTSQINSGNGILATPQKIIPNQLSSLLRRRRNVNLASLQDLNVDKLLSALTEVENMGQRNGPSETDIQKLKKMYKCP